ncbi:hypothetical protein EUGRSUZ_A00902 [Eucalyptus grandis]|uniref:Uncharacterized protein n=1 Tax=Eucalyptus grandis TaxID=71139 RepID=A0ACC3M168_EUCGR|nr:hypothetical protein EUGRSUZ_A00902 [Eucalyptus grandis]
MWKLKIAEGGPWLTSVNNHVGRQHWEFDPDAGTPEERAEVERVRDEFTRNRFRIKQSADLLMRMQLTKENPRGPIPPPVKVEEGEDVTEEGVTTTLRRAISFYSSIQAHDGHWPAENAGPLFFFPPMEDLYYPHPLVQDMLWGFLHHVTEPVLKRWPFSMIREKALKVAIKHVHYEDENSRYLTIGCVEKVLCMIACWVEDPNSEAYKRHLARIPDYYWIAEDGLKMQTFGCQMWDAAFTIQAIMSSNLTEEYATTLRKGHDFVKASQVQDNPSDDFKAMYRHISKGAWTFAMQDHGWQVSDCTAEGLKTALLFSQMSPDLVGEKMETERFYDAVNVILSLQSSNGGFPAWEPQRAYAWLEKFNPTEFFEDTLIEREYVECTSSAIQGLALFKKLHPKHRRKEIDSCIARAIDYIEDTQLPDGSWYGCWGICYTYGTWFAVEGLAACGKSYRNCPSVRKACEFLLSKQLPCGGGESYLSSQNKVYTNLEGNRPNLVQTAWALLSLIDAGQVRV